MTQLLKIFVALLCAQAAASWQIQSRPSPQKNSWQANFNKQLAVASICLVSVCSPPFFGTEPAYAGNDALDGAISAMTAKTAEKPEDTRAFDALPEGAKKRRALALCKEGDERKAAGYASAAACSQDVLDGNYAVATGAGRPAAPPKAAAPASPAASAPSAAAAAAAGAGPQAAAASSSSPRAPREKVLDLADLPPAAQKRRAAAGCKKAEVRKYARFGSEAACTSAVLDGSYLKVVEALEYGL
mmetsp:Transcript_25884/g.42673  ORF Transcript_25884/g.42673 Transcript_25884/m.42673 type:complete len:244 (-) Transcript_25884:544-1275(-)